MTSIKGKHIVIVGGSSGIGRCVAELCIAKGAQITIGARETKRLNETAASLSQASGATVGHQIDATSQDSLRAFFRVVGPFDHLVSMVGGAMGGGFARASILDIREALDRKLLDNIALAQSALETLRHGGSITFTGGTGGRPHTASGAYLGNEGILALAQGLASELAPKLRVNVVAPTWMDTPLWRDMPAEQKTETQAFFNKTVPLGRTATLDEVASAYVFLMENSFITGQQIAIDGGIMLRI